MRMIKGAFPFIAALLLAAGPALADKYSDTVNLFKNAGQSASFFGNSYGYAVFPTIGKAGLGIGGALCLPPSTLGAVEALTAAAAAELPPEGLDPAVANGPLLPAVNDITGILIYFALAATLFDRSLP